MRPLLWIVMFFFLASPSFSQQITSGAMIRVCLDVGGKHAGDYKGESLDYHTDIAPSAGIEIYKASGTGEIGVGVEKQLARGGKDLKGSFSFTPVYLSFRLFTIQTTKAKRNTNIYATGKIGYGFMTGSEDYASGFDVDGGLYFGLGGGMFFAENGFIEAVYSMNKGKANITRSTSIGISYSKIGVYLGIRI